ncbi:MAG TPA: DinB family protein [Bryobacteraceae bacterium]|nr:DinB family protein [Bryobacteraceae bacterium]
MPISAAALRTHIDYTVWASRKLVSAAAQLPPAELVRDFQTADRSVLDTLVHVYAADRLWLARFEGQSPSSLISDDDRSMSVLQNEWPALHERWREWGAALTDDRVLAPLAYTDMSGRPWSQPLWQLVLHVVNHGTHHRGQVSGFLRSMGHRPPQVDLIYYYRELN